MVGLHVPNRITRNVPTFATDFHRCNYGKFSPLNRILLNGNTANLDFFQISECSLRHALNQLVRIKDKINAPPSNPDDQQVPKSLQKIIDLKNKVKSGIFTNKRKKKSKQQEANSVGVAEIKVTSRDNKKAFNRKPEKPIPVFKQYVGETDKEFLNRVNRVCQDVTKEAAFEDKYGVEIKRTEDGEVQEVVKRPKDELEVLIKKARKEQLDKKNKIKKKKKKSQDEAPRLTKSQKWQKKKNEKKLKKKMKNADEFDNYKDHVKFGEIAHAPPTLVAPKKVEKQNAPRPGKKDLLLKSLFDKGDSQCNKLKVVKHKNDKVLKNTTNKAIDKKGKRKNLPNALRRQLDKQQKEIIGAYKELKAKKYIAS